MFKLFLLCAATALVSAAPKCPGSAASVHAQCQVKAVAVANCTVVAEEMIARAEGSTSGAWTDPHNGGKYAVVSYDDSDIKKGGSKYGVVSTLELKRVTGNGKYADRILFTLTDYDYAVQSHAICLVEGCSESQVTSVEDESTNYCNQHNLYCGEADGCVSVKNHFKVDESSVEPSLGAGKDKSKCNVQKKPEVLLGASQITCPGSPSFVHASCQQQASFETSCQVVASEIAARVAGQANGTWHDPHNKGTYAILENDGDVMLLSRKTGNGKYTDKMTITLKGTGNTCVLSGCSESQVMSIADFSTNYCNVRMLYCGADDGCKPATTDLVSKVTSATPSMGAGSTMSDCLKM